MGPPNGLIDGLGSVFHQRREAVQEIPPRTHPLGPGLCRQGHLDLDEGVKREAEGDAPRDPREDNGVRERITLNITVGRTTLHAALRGYHVGGRTAPCPLEHEAGEGRDEV